MGKCVLVLDWGWVYAFAGFRMMLRKSHQVSYVVPPSLTFQRSPLTSNGQLQKELALRLCVSDGFGVCTCLHMFVATDTHLGTGASCKDPSQRRASMKRRCPAGGCGEQMHLFLLFTQIGE